MKTYTLLEACQKLRHPVPVSHSDLVKLADACVGGPDHNQPRGLRVVAAGEK